ncbi:MAG: exopolysaccharide biosynthesis protein [Rhodomicrobium sp.]
MDQTDARRNVLSHVPTSVVLADLIHTAPAGHVTLTWLMGHLPTRSFGIILLLLGGFGLLPLLSPIAGLALFLCASQMIRGHQVPIFPRSVAERLIETDKLADILMRVIPALRYLERFIRPRWVTPFETTQRVIGGFVLLLGLCLLIPVPLSNIPISLTIVLVAFAYLEEDGLLLAVALSITLGVLAVVAAALWSTVAGMIWLARG